MYDHMNNSIYSFLYADTPDPRMLNWRKRGSIPLLMPISSSIVAYSPLIPGISAWSSILIVTFSVPSRFLQS